MEVRYATSPKDALHYTTPRLQEEYLIQNLFEAGEIKMVYSHFDRIISGGVVPIKPIKLEASDELRSAYFLERRELGVINIGGKGSIRIDGKIYEVNNKDGMYIGKGCQDIVFDSIDSNYPAKFYFNSAPAHCTYPSVLIKPSGQAEDGVVIIKDENKVAMGSSKNANERKINKYILPNQVESCQLVMGMTQLAAGSVWNTMPVHTHERRMEVYLYFDLSEDSVVFHYMGEPQETRHITVRNEEAVISPSWSIHSGCGTSAYTFIWGMVGENQAFDDMDACEMKKLK